ncbi:MAG: ABC transporter permease [Proteobacteria bacterium]|nr:ABC transporter permease [Pseudomonadota bacterium]
MFLKIAAGNLWRNKRRTAIIEVSIVFGLVVIVFTGSLINGLILNWAIGAVESLTGSMQVEHKDYEKQSKFKPLETTLSGGQELTRGIEAFPGVTSAFGKLNITGVISNGSKSTTFFGRGVEIRNMKTVLPRINERIGKGRFPGANQKEVLLGHKLAEDLNLKIGDPVMLLVRTLKGGLNMVEMIFVGTESFAGQGDYASAHSVEMSLKAAQSLMRMPDRISQVVVAYDDFYKAPESAEALQEILNRNTDVPLTVKDYTQLIPGYDINRFFKLIGVVVGLVLFIIVGAGIANSMFMSVMERRKEIGTMKALGAEQSTIRRLFILEGILIAAVGSVLGLVLSITVVTVVKELGGVSFPPPPGSSEPITIRPMLDYGSCVYAIVLSLVTAVVASYLPATVSSKLNPVETLREE